MREHEQSVPPFRHRYRVRFDESGPDGLARASTLLRYVQDIAWLHSEDRGYDREWYAARRIAWLVRAAEVVVEASIAMGSTLELSTTVVGHRKVWARRRAEAHHDGRRVAWTHTDWVLVDGRGLPTRIPPEFDDAFPNPVAGFPIGRVELPPVGPDVTRSSFRVRPQELDPNGHVNNAVYLDWLEESIGPGRLEGPRRYRIEYAAPAPTGVELTAESWTDAAGWWHRLSDDGGRELARARVEPGGG